MVLEHITQAQIAAAGVASAPDIVTGTPSEVKAIFDNLVRAVVATAVNLVVDEVNGHEADAENPHAVTKEQVGLGAADNTADADKPVSGPQQAALDLKATKEELQGVVLGQLPDGAVTVAKLAAEVIASINGKAAAVHAANHATGGSDPVTPAQIGAATSELLYCTVLVSWTAVTGGFYTQTVSVPGILESDEDVKADIYPGSDNAANKLYASALSKVQTMETLADAIKFVCTAAPTVAFPLKLEVTR
ncbi:hypothetical protein OBV_23860 [Oscillibacter valericigenes Sjm18-20]|nr:hypothetical protein OBV_23860 [Oscillibacter valericigenes Sjm18-20]